MGLRERDHYQFERVEEDHLEKARCRMDGSRVQKNCQRTET